MPLCKTKALEIACGIALAGSATWCGVAAAEHLPARSIGSSVDKAVITIDRGLRHRESNILRVIDRGSQIPSPQADSGAPEKLSTNPLWAISLDSLGATRERPIFSPSRRPLAPPIAAVGPPRASAPPPAPPNRTRLTLIGTVVGTSEKIAVLLDETTKGIIRMRTGDGHSGWMLRSVKSREAVIESDGEKMQLAFSSAGGKPDPTKAPLVTVPSPPSIGDRASRAITMASATFDRASPAITDLESLSPTGTSLAQNGGASPSPAPPAFAGRAAPALTPPGVSNNSDRSPAAPDFGGRAAPAVTAPGASADPNGPPAPPAFGNRAAPAIAAPGPLASPNEQPAPPALGDASPQDRVMPEAAPNPKGVPVPPRLGNGTPPAANAPAASPNAGGPSPALTRP